MKRKDFLKKSMAFGALGIAAPSILSANNPTFNSTYDKMIDQVGFNHLPNNESKTMNSVLHKANTRGHANHGWLQANHSFSFANYYNPERMHFGVLRVLNDDTIAPAMGFPTHPHDNMEIITIPLEGDLEHKDNMGNGTIIKNGDIQVMSAGTGITHSEFNANKGDYCKLLQIWLFPNKRNVTPRYDQIAIRSLAKENSLYQVLSPNKDDDGVWIHQNAWFNIGEYDKPTTETYSLHKKENGVYLFVIEGKLKIDNQSLEKRDGYGTWDTDEIEFTAEKSSKVLLMELPMQIS
tara:strand:- start:745 stop:1623 length:879 start_codon:yes stop_codon:yes gene_type:complete